MVEEFKRRMNGAIRRKLMEVENQSSLIEQWFRRAIAFDRIGERVEEKKKD